METQPVVVPEEARTVKPPTPEVKKSRRNHVLEVWGAIKEKLRGKKERAPHHPVDESTSPSTAVETAAPPATTVKTSTEKVVKKKELPPLVVPSAPLHPNKSFLSLAARTIIEMIPGGLGPWGIGDAITLVEGIRGKEIGGRKLDLVDRGISLLAAAMPLVPATPFRDAIRMSRREIGYTFRKMKYAVQNSWRKSHNKDQK